MLDFKRFPATTLLLAAIGLVFLLETSAGGSTDPRVLVALGANVPELVRHGELWRLVTSMFLHIGIFHLLINGWALLQLGGLFELLIGPLQLLAVYFVAGIAGSAASLVWTRSLSAGASGAIFGLLGALIAFLLLRRRALLPRGRGLLGQLVVWAAINVALGFNMPGIDNAGHLGGFAAGLLAGIALRPRDERFPPPPAPTFPSDPSPPAGPSGAPPGSFRVS